jgi:hypothetical protein
VSKAQAKSSGGGVLTAAPINMNPNLLFSIQTFMLFVVFTHAALHSLRWSHVRPRPPPTHIIFPARFHKGPVLVLAYLPYHLFSLGGSYALTFSCGPEHKTPVHFFQPAAPRARARVLSTQFGVLTAASKPHLFT